ncbi:C40 family peptidase [Aquariibacter lacus]|nr:C40 family peptidase [Piscinibacter lacus]
MPKPAASARPAQPRRPGLRWAGGLLAGLLMFTAAQGAPRPTGPVPAPAAAPAASAPALQDDPLLHLLHERGVLHRQGPAGPRAGPWVPDGVSDWASELVISAMNFLGVRYRRGGESAHTGFDCSGFTRHVFESTLGLVLPRRSADQARAPGWLKVDRHELKPGDLVFFNTLRSTFSHVGIYVGDDKFIHAPRTGLKVKIEDMRNAYWVKRYNGARRAPVDAAAALAALRGEAPAER